MDVAYDIEAQKYADLTAKEGKTYDISDVEIFAAGKYNGDEYSIADLDAMVESFAELSGKIKPFLKLGHDENQKLLQKDGMPAAGWITGLKRAGDKLMATFSAVPEKIYELIAAKAYGRFSSEIYWNLKDGQKKYPRVLKAVALLGADTPAVQTLDDFINLYTEDAVFEIVKAYHELQDGENMEKAEFEKQYSELQAQIAQAKEELKKYSDENAALKTTVAEKERAVKSAKVNQFLDANKDKFVPAQREAFFALAMSEGESEILHVYSEGDAKKEIKGTPFDIVRQIIENNHKQPDMTTQTNYTEVQKGDNSDDDVLFNKAMEYSQKNGVSYKQALLIVGKEG